MCVYGSDGDLARYVAVVTGDMAGHCTLDTGMGDTGVTHGELQPMVTSHRGELTIISYFDEDVVYY